MVRWSFCLLLCLQALLWAGPASARPPGEEGERQQRRMELRQHIEAERERWHADGRRGGAQAPGGPGPRGDAPPAHGYGGPMRHGQPPGFAPPAGGRLSPEERRALRQELRNQRP